eukprot:1157918-Pelagomonas_calceolata.AAC.8
MADTMLCWYHHRISSMQGGSSLLLWNGRESGYGLRSLDEGSSLGAMVEMKLGCICRVIPL